MFMPRVDPKKQKVKDRLSDLLFWNECRNSKDIRVMNCHVHPHAQWIEGWGSFIGMPKDPVVEAKWLGYCLKRIDQYAGFYRRATLEHEKAELYILRKKGLKRGKEGIKYRKQSAINDGYCDHSSVHPLIAEANASGRSPQMLKAMIHEWRPVPAQRKIYPLLKQYGWTPVTGLPMYGRIADRIQKAAEKIYQPYFRALIDSQLSRLERRYKGRALRKKKEGILAVAREYAGGKGLRKKYL